MLVDVNVNMNRCGVHPPEAVELAKLVVELESTVGGVKVYGFMIQRESPFQDRDVHAILLFCVVYGNLWLRRAHVSNWFMILSSSCALFC